VFFCCCVAFDVKVYTFRTFWRSAIFFIEESNVAYVGDGGDSKQNSLLSLDTVLLAFQASAAM
jgi:hypothetical protein